MTYFYICDSCGSIDISEQPHPPTQLWACGRCESTSLLEFTDQAEALQHARTIQDKRYRDDMERLYAAIARSYEKGQS